MFSRVTMLGLGAAFLALAACETTEGYQQRMNLWTGRLSDDLVIDWGVPENKERLSDGREVWSYFRSSVTESAGYYRDETRDVTRTFTDKDGKKKTETIQETFPVWVPPTTTRVECNTRFVIGATSRVEQVSFNGNGCVAAPLD
jgi:hypothetical protein